jgi:hypothetical protein
MTTKTIPEYLEAERRQLTEAQLRTEEEAARIQASRHGHRRTAKRPKIESPRQPRAATKTKTTGSRKKTRVTRKAATKARKSGGNEIYVKRWSRQERKMAMKPRRACSFGLCCGLALILGFGIVPAATLAADAPPIVGDWTGTLNPGAQPKKQILVHISVGQDGTLSGTIDYPDQNTSGTLITAITYKAPALHFESSSSLTSYDGTFKQSSS